MNKIIKILAWIAGAALVILLFSEATAELFPLQVVAWINVGVLIYAKTARRGLTNEN